MLDHFTCWVLGSRLGVTRARPASTFTMRSHIQPPGLEIQRHVERQRGNYFRSPGTCYITCFLFQCVSKISPRVRALRRLCCEIWLTWVAFCFMTSLRFVSGYRTKAWGGGGGALLGPQRDAKKGRGQLGEDSSEKRSKGRGESVDQD